MSAALGSTTRFGHLQEAVEAVEKRIADVLNGTTNKVKASAGLILARRDEAGKIEFLMGRLNKLNRPTPKDEAGVHGSYGIFSGGVELEDSGSDVPAVCKATAREVEEESLGALSQEDVLDLLSLPTTKLIKNAGWKYFTAASFYVEISEERSKKIVDLFNSKSENAQQHEITALAWVSLNQILEAQTKKEERYNALCTELERAQGRRFSTDELRVNEALGNIYNENLELPNGIRVAHFVARTIFGLKDNL